MIQTENLSETFSLLAVEKKDSVLLCLQSSGDDPIIMFPELVYGWQTLLINNIICCHPWVNEERTCFQTQMCANKADLLLIFSADNSVIP